MKYKCLPLLVMVFMALNIVCPILSSKIVAVPVFGCISAGVVIGSIWFSFMDVIAEVYGMKISIYMALVSAIYQIFLAFLWGFMVDTPSPNFWHEQHSYNFLFGSITGLSFFEFIGMLTAWYANAYFLTRWKVLTNGKYFWLRSIGSSIIGIVAFWFVMNVSNFYSSGVSPYGYHNALILASSSLYIKIIYVVILSFPCSLLVILLKVIENVNGDEKNFKPNLLLSSNRKSSI